MVFDLVGSAGDQTNIVISDEPTDREAVLDDFSTDIGITANVGSVTINGGGSGNTDLTVTIPDRVTSPNSTVCLPFSVQNFNDIQSIQFTVDYDPTVVTYNRVQSFGLPFLDEFDFNTALAAMGQVGFFWADDSTIVRSLADGDVLFEMCFDAVGALGSSTPVEITGSPVAIEFFGNGQTYVVGSGLTLNQGSITIQEGVVTPPQFNVGMVTGDVGDIVCVPVEVVDFTDIVSFRHSISWNDAHLRFVEVANFTLPGLGGNDFNNISSSQLNAIWDSPSSDNFSVGNGPIYDMCFEILSPCDNGAERPVNIAQVGPAEVGRINASGIPVEIPGVIYNNGSVKCETEIDCPTVTAIAADCQDGAGDLLVGDISGLDASCECRWTGPATQTTTVGSGSCNFVGVPAGAYTLTIVCDGETVCTVGATVAPAPMITVNGNVTNASCGELGSITVLPEGGTMPYMFSWSNGMNTPTITGLQPDTYTVTVTDAASCSNMRTFTVSADVTELTISDAAITPVSCNGGADGAVALTIDGGCSPYSFVWTGSTSTTETATGLSAGMVSVVVTDDNGSTVTMSYTITEPDAIAVVATTNPACPGTAEGSISLAVTGGTAPYTAAWTPPDTGLTLTDLLPGMYTVTITDGNQCEFTATYEVEPRDPAMCDGSCPTASNFTFNDYNGFGVSCNGADDGSVEFDIANGAYPLSITLAGPAAMTVTAAADGVVSFDNLSAGEYTITSTDGAGMTCSIQVFTVTEPVPFVITNVSTGDVVTGCDGFIDYDLTGGVGAVTCFLNGVVEADCDFSNLCEGMYVISFVDANGCEVQRMERIRNVNGPEGPCYQANTVITPNQDGANDFFVVSCVEDFPTRLQVFDRWGGLVFEQQEYDNTWEAVDLNGVDLPESAYMYALSVNFGSGRTEIFKGTLTVLR
jgi:gliding motility-associated-like protein